MELQEELLMEILAQLPVKSLIRFTCVCKYWHSIITSSEFATKHYETRLKLNQYNYDSILTEFSPARSMSIFSYQDLTFQTAFKFRPAVAYDPPKFGISHREITCYHRIYGPCNGLFLLQFMKHSCHLNLEPVWLLWNPAIRDVLRVPSLQGFGSSFVGFGFDDVNNDYKIVFFAFDVNLNCKSSVLLYSLAANSWRQLDVTLDIGYGGQPNPAGPAGYSSNNGRKHHWMMSEYSRRGRGLRQTRCTSFLLSFDFVDEVFVQTLMPFDEEHEHPCKFLDQGSNNVYPTICCVVDEADATTKSMHIWGLNNYGPTGSWSKLRSLTIPKVIANSSLLFWKNNNAIVFANRGDQQALTLYDLITKEMTSLKFRGDQTILAYTESLVSVAKFVRPPPPPPPPHYSLVAASLQDHQMNSVPQHRLLSPEEYSSLEAEFQQLLQENYGNDDDDSSTDSAFLMPLAPPYGNHNAIFVDYETDLKFLHYRGNEIRRLLLLPYCLREVNQPMISNPCTF